MKMSSTWHFNLGQRSNTGLTKFTLQLKIQTMKVKIVVLKIRFL